MIGISCRYVGLWACRLPLSQETAVTKDVNLGKHVVVCNLSDYCHPMLITQLGCNSQTMNIIFITMEIHRYSTTG